jgi:DNA-binding transcriptional LysR family regulator
LKLILGICGIVLNHLKIINTHTNEKSFTKAANKLYITQPAISRYIAAFEKELGLGLFDRSNNQAILTTNKLDVILVLDNCTS